MSNGTQQYTCLYITFGSLADESH